MAYSTIALAALAAAQAAAPQTESGLRWVPLEQARKAESQQAPATESTAPAQPATSPQPADASGPPVAPVEVPPTAESSIRQGIVLWRNVEDGMTVAALRTLYPQGPNVIYKDDRTVLGDVPIIDGCEAKVNIMHPGGVVKEIVMRGEGSIAGRCSIRIITALSGKYGEPLDKDKVKGSLFGREGKNYIWSHDGVTLQFKRYTNGPFGGGGLLAASWEMRYTVNAANIDL